MNRLSKILSRHIAEPAARQAVETIDVLSRRQLASARALQMNHALLRLCEFLADPANLRNGVILLPVPWGSSGRWALTRDERDALRGWVIAGIHNRRTGRRITTPFSYDAGARRWLLTMQANEASAWLEAYPVSANDVLRHWPQRPPRR